MADDEIWLMPEMTGVPAVVSEAEGALSMFPDGFAGIMVGAQAVPDGPPLVVVGVLDKSGRFLAGGTPLVFAKRVRELLDIAIEGVERGDFDAPRVAQ